MAQILHHKYVDVGDKWPEGVPTRYEQPSGSRWTTLVHKQGAPGLGAGLHVWWYVMDWDVKIQVDLNVRVGYGETYAGFEDIHGKFPHEDDMVWVFEPESRLRTHATIKRIDRDREMIYMEVYWGSLEEYDDEWVIDD